MVRIIDLDARKKLKEDLSRAEKVQGLQSLLRCSLCGLRCTKCGMQGEPNSRVTHPGTGVTFRLCPSCLDEYTDLMAYLEKGAKSESPSWYNREWVRQWLAWLDYQWSIANYLSSAEVLAVLNELKAE